MGNGVLLQASFSQIDANWDQQQTYKECDWKNQEDDDPNVWIIDLSPHLKWQYKQK